MNQFDANVPIYQQIMNGIKQQLVAGTLHPGDKLPSVREQSEALTVNPNTVQRAYQELEREGISETRRGMGSFIVERASIIEEIRMSMAESIMSAFMDGMRKLGFTDDAIKKEVEKALSGAHKKGAR